MGAASSATAGGVLLGILLAAVVGLVFALAVTPLFARLVARLRWGQQVRVDGPTSHLVKRGTPSMGGVVIVLGSVIGYFVGALGSRRAIVASALLVLLLLVGLGLVGFIDDYLKARKQQSLGLTGWAKIGGQVVVAVLFAVLALMTPPRNGITAVSETISGFRDTSWDWDLTTRFGAGVAATVFTIWIAVIVLGASNGVNIADGLDGLAPGTAVLAFMSYLAITFWQYEQACKASTVHLQNVYRCYAVRDPLDLAIVSAAIMGALIGFLWWNTPPARIFMGDTGSLSLGGALAGLAVLSRTELLLLVIGGLFVIVTGSVILQRAYFRISGGKRIFLMSPLHHHFELKGWAEVTVVVRFWIIALVCGAAGVGAFYLDWTLY